MEKKLKKLIIATAVMSSCVSILAGPCASKEHNKELKRAANQNILTPSQKRKQLTSRERKQLDKRLVEAYKNLDTNEILDLLMAGANPNAQCNHIPILCLADNDIIVQAFVFAGAQYHTIPLSRWLSRTIKNAITEREKAFNRLRALKKIMRDQMANNPHMSIDEIAYVSVDGQIPYSQHEAHNLLNILIACEWENIKKELVLEQEASRVLLNGSLLPVPALIDLVHSYTHLQKEVQYEISEESIEQEEEKE